MAMPLSNRSLEDEVFRLGQQNYLLLLRAKAAEAQLSSLVLRHGNLELDRLTRACRLNGRPCPLTGLEYELLAFLLLHRGRVWSRAELVERVWQSEPTSINLVAIYITSLRKKLGSGIVRTIRGQGYTIDDESNGQLSVVGRQPPNHKSRRTRL
ncbi:MAG: winged helix-turn-helix domain-containing protein [Terracidiphilus sp.]